MARPTYLPGFRLSSFDILVLGVGGILALAVGSFTRWGGFIVGFVLAHFFLFCNVFRLARSLELLWSGLFIVLAGLTIVADTPGWIATTVISLGMTLVVVLIEVRKPSYHGIGWQWLNPGLPAWWAAQQTDVRVAGE